MRPDQRGCYQAYDNLNDKCFGSVRSDLHGEAVEARHLIPFDQRYASFTKRLDAAMKKHGVNRAFGIRRIQVRYNVAFKSGKWVVQLGGIDRNPSPLWKGREARHAY